MADLQPILYPKNLDPLLQSIHEQGGNAIFVGGFIRDQLLGISSTDIDIEVFHIESYDALKKILSPFGEIHEFGKSFGILQMSLETIKIDFALPRTEYKSGTGHTGFTVTHNPNLSYTEASSRRDFTINSIGYNPHTKTILDPHNGIDDLKNKTLRHISDAFKEDSLRVYRAIQFAGRFELKIAKETLDLCRSISINDLPKERLFEEFKKLFLKAKRPSKGLIYMNELGLFEEFPECKALYNCPQEPEWHPEGDVWTHTLMVVDEMAKLKPAEPEQALTFMFAALCHDFGKPMTTKKIDGKWRSPGHEAEGVEPSKTFMERLTNNSALIDGILPLVKHHLKPALLYKADQSDGVSDAAIRRLSTKVCIEDLVLLARADHYGRGTKDAINKEFPAGEWLLNRAQKLNVKNSEPIPLVTGKDLIKHGIAPGKEMGLLLDQLYEKQLNGEIKTKEDGLNLL